MSAILLQGGDNRLIPRELAEQYLRHMVTSRQVREALRKLRTDARREPWEFADEARVDRATVYRIEKFDKPYSPKIETISALVESRGLTLAAFFAAIEGVAMKVTTSDPETEADVQRFRALSPDARRVALGLAAAVSEYLPPAPSAESPRESPPGARTKSAQGRRR